MDESSIREFCVINLKRWGMVLEAGSGEDALRLMRNRDVDIALLDIMLPGMDGFAVCRGTAERSGYHIGIIMLDRAFAGDGKRWAV